MCGRRLTGLPPLKPFSRTTVASTSWSIVWGVSAGSPLAETTLAEWRHVLSTNLDGAFLATKHGIRAMRAAGGAIVHVGSASGIRPAAGAAAYSTSKAALRMLVRTAAKGCRDARTRVRGQGG